MAQGSSGKALRLQQSCASVGIVVHGVVLIGTTQVLHTCIVNVALGIEVGREELELG